MKFTKGPWIVDGYEIKTADDGTVICDMSFGDVTREIGECSGNGSLIAAAPTLLEALVSLRDWIETGCDPSKLAMSKVNAAIARAEGRS